MNILALELSSERASVALANEGGLVNQREWENPRFNQQKLFESLKLICPDSSSWDSVDLYAIGRGPGSFSGLRTAFAVVNALALPDDKPIRALSSGESIAAAVEREQKAERIAVVGDARRKKVWFAIFEKRECALFNESGWKLEPLEDLAGLIPEGTLVASPDWSRLGEFLKRECSHCQLIERALFPRASVLADLMQQKIKCGWESDPLEPLYMHPPVFVKPSFVPRN